MAKLDRDRIKELRAIPQDKIDIPNIPRNFIKTKPIDWRQELYTLTGCHRTIGGVSVKPPPLGVFMMLEMFDCPFFNEFGAELDLIHCYRAAFCNHYRNTEAAQLIADWRGSGDETPAFDWDREHEWTDFDKAVVLFAVGMNFNSWTGENWCEFRMMFAQAMEGMEMIPKGGGGSFSENIFGAECLGSIMSGIGEKLNASIDEILWDIPFFTIGHTMAQAARFNGTKGVARPVDFDHLDQLVKEAQARVVAGELHPWQIEEPLNPLRGITELQEAHSPGISEVFIALQKKARENGKT